MKWSKEQERAISLDNRNILVSAAAGSGKTAVLVERVVSHLLREEKEANAWDADRLMIVTFTRAAATEMSQRIEKRLQGALEEELAKEKRDTNKINRLKKQMILLAGASISTIDSFCQNIIRNNFSEIDLDPSFRVAETNALLLLQQDALEELFEELYKDSNEDIICLDNIYGLDRGDESLYKLVLRLYSKAMTHPFPQKWLKNLSLAFDMDSSSLKDYEGWSFMLDSMKQALEMAFYWLKEFKALVEQIDDLKVRTKYDGIKERLEERLEAIAESLKGEWDDIYQEFTYCLSKDRGFLRMPGGKINIDAELREELKEANNRIKEIINFLYDEYILDKEAVSLENMRHTAEGIKALVNVTLGFHEKFSGLKKSRNIVDFNDMEHLALNLLIDSHAPEGELIPSNIALKLRKKYQEIMVDEYQDTNELQNAIISLIAGENQGNLFMVGDVKQSIYGFRSSEPRLFLDKYEEYSKAMKEGKAGSGELITLGKNFRSRREVLSAVNLIFGQLMCKNPFDINYDEAAMLYPGEPYGYKESPEGRCIPPEEAVELNILYAETKEELEENEEEELKGFTGEAVYIAQRIKEIIASGYMIFDKAYTQNEGYRPISYKDIVILLRSVQGKAGILQEELQKRGIPVFAEQAGGYFSTTEIQVMTSLLAIIDNSRQDIPLAGVLYSPIVGLSAEVLAKLRLLNGEDLFSCLLKATAPDCDIESDIKEKCSSFIINLNRWRNLAREIGVPELLWTLYQETGYYEYIGCMPGGVLRQANLRMLVEKAEAFEKNDFRGLFRFLRFIEKIQALNTEMSNASILGENADVVRVMTIHKSKGLEFPVVILGDMGKRFNEADLKEEVLIHKKFGLGLDYVDLQEYIKYPTFAKNIIKNKLSLELKAEELRVLYVAMTRAREKLILVGSMRNNTELKKICCDYLEYKIENTGKNYYLPAYFVAGANSYIKWIVAAAARHKDAVCLAEEFGYSRGEYDQRIGFMNLGIGVEAHIKWKLNQLSLELPSSQEEAGENIADKIKRGEIPDIDPALSAKINDILTWKYDFMGTEGLPSKLSVTEIKKYFSQEDIYGQPVVEEANSFERPVFAKLAVDARDKNKLTGSEYGTLMHRVMQKLSLEGNLDLEDIKKQLELLVEREIFSSEDISHINLLAVERFWHSGMGLRLRRAKKLWRELPFSRMLSMEEASRYYPQVDIKASGGIFNQGVLDVLFEDEAGNLILLDYKTDKNTETSVVLAKYKLQIELYDKAIEGIFGKRATERYLYMLHDGKIISV